MVKGFAPSQLICTNLCLFDIVAPPLTLAKTVPKSYQTDNGEYFIHI